MSMERQLARVLQEELELKGGTFAQPLIRELRKRTPVRTGRLQAGWRIVGNRLLNRVPYASIVVERNTILNEYWRRITRGYRS